jgi:hypothetical protein
VIESYGNAGVNRLKQLKWLEEDLAATRALWKVVSVHVPMVATRTELAWFGFDDYRPLLEKYGVDLVVAGHHPMYRRYLPIGRPGEKPILHITSGGGGPVSEPVPSPILVKGGRINHHTLYRVDGNKMEITAVLTDGTVFDKFTLVKTNGRYQEAVMAAAVDPDTALGIRNLYEELTDHRFQLVAGFAALPQAGRPVKILLDTQRLPRGKLDLEHIPAGIELTVQAKPGSQWKIEPQAQKLAEGTLAFDAVAPAGVGVESGRLRPPLELMINLKLGERAFQPHTCLLAPPPEAIQELFSPADGLPVMWDFRLDPRNQGVAARWFAPDAGPEGWRKLAITAWWEGQLNDEYDGSAWYRATVAVPPVQPGEKLAIEFGAIDESCWLYVNGKKAGEFVYDEKVDPESWQKPKRFDITSVVQPGDNLIVVKVQDLMGKGGIYRGARFVRSK